MQVGGAGPAVIADVSPVKPIICDNEQVEHDKQRKHLEKDELDVVDRAVETHVRRYLRCQVYPSDLDTLPEVVRSDEIANHEADEHGHVVLYFGSTIFAESRTRPETRRNPVPTRLYNQIVSGVLVGRDRGSDGKATLNPHEFVAINDGGRVNWKSLLKPWQRGLELHGDDNSTTRKTHRNEKKETTTRTTRKKSKKKS